MPVLILQGERDAQVLAYHAIQLATSLTQAGDKNVSLRILPNLGHLFNSVEDANISETMLYDLQTWADKTLKP
jgi:dipeptidyl aminopeptidase/acylaminoacyl peptidase